MEIHASSKKPLTIFELIQPALVAIIGLNLFGLGMETYPVTSRSFVVSVISENCLQFLSIALSTERQCSPDWALMPQ